MERKPKLVIVEDDEMIRQELEVYLKNAGYGVTAVLEFSDVTEHILRKEPDLILLDVNLPGISGLTVCGQIRQKSSVPIIFVTGNNTSMDELNCILRGGDDYVSKPYQLPVLMARIGAVLRRTMHQVEASSARMEHRGVVLDTGAAQIGTGAKKRDLTKNELKILFCLFQHKGEIVSRTEMIDYLWDNEVFIDDNTLSVNITRIRSKLEEIGVTDFIETKRGMGYRI